MSRAVQQATSVFAVTEQDLANHKLVIMVVSNSRFQEHFQHHFGLRYGELRQAP